MRDRIAPQPPQGSGRLAARLFKPWFGVGAPLYFGLGLVCAFKCHVALGVFTLALYLIGIANTACTTCVRCPNYGTGNCGLPGRFVATIFKRRTDRLPRWRIWLHHYADIMITVYVLILTATQPPLLVPALVWATVAWFLVLKPRRFHGLLYQIR